MILNFKRKWLVIWLLASDRIHPCTIYILTLRALEMTSNVAGRIPIGLPSIMTVTSLSFDTSNLLIEPLLFYRFTQTTHYYHSPLRLRRLLLLVLDLVLMILLRNHMMMMLMQIWKLLFGRFRADCNAEIRVVKIGCIAMSPLCRKA